MKTTPSYTSGAKGLVGSFVQRAGKTFLVVKATNAFGEPATIKITPANLAEFFATQANNLSSGMRTPNLSSALTCSATVSMTSSSRGMTSRA